MSENDESPDDEFEKVEIEPIEPETVWAEESGDSGRGESIEQEPGESIEQESGESTGHGSDESTGQGSDESTEQESAMDAETESGNPSVGERVIDKQAYCHQCPHLSSPPKLECLHAGTEILEVVDGERFRVQNCPVVEREEAFEDVSKRA